MTTSTARPTAEKKRKYSFTGRGRGFQFLGLVALIFWPWGTLIGACMLAVGHIESTEYHCARCGSKLGDKSAVLCPGCGAVFR